MMVQSFLAINYSAIFIIIRLKYSYQHILAQTSFWAFLLCMVCHMGMIKGLSAQEALISQELALVPIAADQSEDIEKFFTLPIKGDSLALSKLVNQAIYYWRDQGYYSFNLDSISYKRDSVFAHFFIGPSFLKSSISIPDSVLSTLNKTGANTAWLDTDSPVLAKLDKYTDEVLDYYEERGHPFASIYLQEVSIDKRNTIYGNLKLVKNKEMVIDSFNISGNVNISNSYLENYLGIKKGDPYSKSKILGISNRIKNLRFLTLKRNPTLSFFDNKTTINLDLKKSKSSSFDFIIGLLRNSSLQSQYTITGEFTAEFLNKLGQGERIYAQFQRLKPEVQELELAANYPYIFGLPFGIEGSINIYRNRDDFLNVNIDAGIQYYFDADNYVKLYYDISSSNLLNIDTLSILNTQRLPDQLDVSYKSAGLYFIVDRRDYRVNASKGYSVAANAQIGFKTVSPNLNIENLRDDDINFSNAYDTIMLKSYQLEMSLDMSYYIPLIDNISILTRSKSALKYSESKLYENEYFRIGGNRILRGFDEQSIQNTFYSILTTELRFLLAQESGNFTLSLPFIDYAWEYNPLRENLWDNPVGIGVGLNFETGSGLFSFAIASGKRRDLNFEFNNLKIHFGYVSLF